MRDLPSTRPRNQLPARERSHAGYAPARDSAPPPRRGWAWPARAYARPADPGTGPGAGISLPRLSAMLSDVKTTRTKDPRPTLAAYGAPLAGFAPLREMPLEEAVVRALVAARRDATVALVLPLVLLKNAARLRTRFLRKLGREQGVEAELGMMLDLAAALRPAPRLSSAAGDCGRSPAHLLPAAPRREVREAAGRREDSPGRRAGASG